MNKKTFLKNLTIGLKALKIDDISDVLKDYEGHFARESEKGKSEETIALELGDLDQILKDYSPESTIPFQKKPRAATLTGLIVLDILMVLSAFLFYGIFLSLIATTISFVIIGIYYLIGLDLISVLPALPTVSLEILLGVSLIIWGAFTGSCSVLYGNLISRMGKNYRHWHKCETTGLRLPKEIGFKKTMLGKVTIVTGITAFLVFVLFYVLAALAANNLEFWHTWNWFR